MSGHKRLIHRFPFTRGLSLVLVLMGTVAHANGGQVERMRPAIPILSDFKKVLAHTYENNPDVAKSAAEQKVTAEGVPKAMSGWRPSFELKGSHTNKKTHPTASTVRSRDASDTGQGPF